jgi:hypothetical protein
MSSQSRVVELGALPPNKIEPLEPGAKNFMESAIIKQNNQSNLQNKLGGRKKRKSCLRGGAVPLSSSPAVVEVTPTPSSAPNQQATTNNNTEILKLAVANQNSAAYDKLATNGNPGDTARIAAEQQATYTGKGGSIKRRRTASKSKKGGSWPVWGCLSGGKKSRKTRRSRRKTRKHMKRHRH